jgi:RsiW-degrading membrane proteinase PrsW (M82 family)
MTDVQPGQSPRSGFWATVRAVLWSFVGIRRKRDYQRDAAELKPLHVVVAGLIGGVVFVLVIVVAVKIIIANAGPAG